MKTISYSLKNKQVKIFVLFVFILVLFFFKGCKTGYVKNSGRWSWITIDENSGKRYHPIVGVENGTFQVLSNKSFALDKNQVYYEGRKINQATPQGFVV